MKKRVFIKLLFFFFCLHALKLESTEVFQEKNSNNYLELLQQASIRVFVEDLLIKYWKGAQLPFEWIPSILNILTDYSENPEFALHLVQEKFPSLTDPFSSFYLNYKGARFAKFETFSQAIAPFVKGPIVADVGGESTNLVELLMNQVPNLEKMIVTDINPVKQQPHHSKIECIWQPCPDRTPLKPLSVDTVIMTTVLHHIEPYTRLKLLIHIKEVLKEGGRLIILEDSYHEGFSKTEGMTPLEATFLAFDQNQKKDIVSFLDWWGNRLMKNARDIPLPCTYKSIEGWKVLFEEMGFIPVQASFLGIPNIPAHVMAPKALFVFEKSSPSISLTEQEKAPSPIESITRVDSNREMMAFVPLSGVNINVSITGSKIQACVIDKDVNELMVLEEYYWRHALLCEERKETLSPEAKRDWMVEQIANQILAAEQALKKKFQEGCTIENIGIAWGGPVKSGKKVIGPNIYGFRFQDLTLKERKEGGIDLVFLLQKKLHRPFLGGEYSIILLNDGDAAAIANFKRIGKKDGFLLTVGAGIGSGVVSQGEVLHSIEDFEDRIGEIGHHIVYHPERARYFYYGVLSRGKIWERMTPYSLSERLAGPGLARRFLAILKSEYRNRPGGVGGYLNSLSRIQFSRMELAACEENRDLGPIIEKKLIKFINVKGKEGDPCALSYIEEAGFELGLGLGVFIKQFQEQPYVKHLILSGTIGRVFGKKVFNKYGEDIFLSHVLKGIRWSLDHHVEEMNVVYLEELENIVG